MNATLVKSVSGLAQVPLQVRISKLRRALKRPLLPGPADALMLTLVTITGVEPARSTVTTPPAIGAVDLIGAPVSSLSSIRLPGVVPEVVVAVAPLVDDARFVCREKTTVAV